jgi:hypothetical protein
MTDDGAQARAQTPWIISTCRLFCRRLGCQAAANAPVLLVHVMKENVERFRFNANHFLEVFGYSFDQFIFLFFALSAVHVNLYDRHKSSCFNAPIEPAKITSQIGFAGITGWCCGQTSSREKHAENRNSLFPSTGVMC